jgi:hypothetical protein
VTQAGAVAEELPRPRRWRLTFSLPALLVRHWALLASLAFVAAVYAPTLNDYFHGDDFLAFIDLASKQPLAHLWDVIRFQDSNIFWRPLGQAYYLAVYEAFGLNEVAFHAASIAVFLATLVLVYVFCLKAGLGRMVGVGAVIILGIFPNHPLSVAWTTAAPRFIGVMFLMAAVVLVQHGVSTRRVRYEVLAVLAFILACLADETLALLAPVPVLVGLVSEQRVGRWLLRAAIRCLPFAAVALVIVYLQTAVGPSHDPTLKVVRVGDHMLHNYWALSAKLVLPVKDGVAAQDIAPEQWIAGGVAGLVGLHLLIAGSWRVRLLVVWVVLGLAPFSLWVEPITPSRYVYMAAVPFAVLLSWFVVWVLDSIMRLSVWRALPAGRWAALALAPPVIVALVVGALLSARETRARNDAFARQTEEYRILAEQLPKALKDVPPGATIVIYYGIWESYAAWPASVLRTVYKDPTIRFVNVTSDRVDFAAPYVRPNDRVVFYTGEGFIVPLPPAASNQ